MDDIDEMLTRAAPDAVDPLSDPARSARGLALSVAASRPRRRMRWPLGVAVAGALLVGGTATAAAAPALFDWSWGSADTLSVQEFPVGDDAAGQSCAMALWAEAADPDPTPEVSAAVQRAQEFLRDHDWSALDDDTSNIWARHRQAVIADGSATPQLLASLTAAQVRDDLDHAGLFVSGMAISTRIDCTDETDDADGAHE